MGKEVNKITDPALDRGGVSSLDTNLPVSVSKKLIENATLLEQAKITNEEKKSERGWLGRFFGSGIHSPNNIAGLLILVLLFIAVCYTAFMLVYEPKTTHSNVLDFWGIITPLITLSLGYLFGKSS